LSSVGTVDSAHDEPEQADAMSRLVDYALVAAGLDHLSPYRRLSRKKGRSRFAWGYPSKRAEPLRRE
jgi:hypothetical protein